MLGGEDEMKRSEYMACLRDLDDERKDAEASGDEDRRLGAVMALEAFLSCFRIPPEEMSTSAPKTKTK
jgi:hypothetical protein